MLFRLVIGIFLKIDISGRSVQKIRFHGGNGSSNKRIIETIIAKTHYGVKWGAFSVVGIQRLRLQHIALSAIIHLKKVTKKAGRSDTGNRQSLPAFL